LMRSAHDGGALKVYGSGLLSSFGEIAHAIDAPDVQRFPFQIEWVVNQGFEIDHYQPLLYVVDSFDHLFALVTELVQWMRADKRRAASAVGGRAGRQRRGHAAGDVGADAGSAGPARPGGAARPADPDGAGGAAADRRHRRQTAHLYGDDRGERAAGRGRGR